MSVAQTTARSHNSVARPTSPSRASHKRQTQGSATQMAPKAVQRGSASFVSRAAHKTKPAPTTAVPRASPVEASEAAATATRTTATSTTPVRPKSPPRHSRPHSHAITAAAAAVNNGSHGQPNQIAATGSGARTSAEATRWRKGPFAKNPRAPAKRRVRVSARSNRGSEAPFAAAEFVDRLLQVAFRKIGPQRLRKNELGIGALPKEKIADALLAARPDQQIRIGKLRGKQVASETSLVDRVYGESAGRHLPCNLADRGDNLGAGAIGQCDRQGDPTVITCHSLGVLNHADDVGIQLAQLTDHLQANSVTVQFGNLATQVMAQQAHQIVDLRRRPLPILRGEAEQCEVRNPKFGRGNDRAPRSLGTPPMAGDPRQAVSLRPAPVAVHDDRDMPRHGPRRGGGAHQT